MKDNRVLTGSLCALGCEVLYGLSYLFTKQTAETASPLFCRKILREKYALPYS